MTSKRKQILMRQKASFERELQERKSFLSGKGVKSPQADRDTIVRKLRATIGAVNNRLRMIAENDRRAEEVAKLKAEKAAAPRKEEESKKGEKAKKAAEEGKVKKIKADKKSAPSKSPEGGKSPKTTESAEPGKAPKEKKVEEKKEESSG